MHPNKRWTIEDSVSLALALIVTATFATETIASWPKTFRFDEFKLVHENPFKPLLQTDRLVTAAKKPAPP